MSSEWSWNCSWYRKQWLVFWVGNLIRDTRHFRWSHYSDFPLANKTGSRFCFDFYSCKQFEVWIWGMSLLLHRGPKPPGVRSITRPWAILELGCGIGGWAVSSLPTARAEPFPLSPTSAGPQSQKDWGSLLLQTSPMTKIQRSLLRLQCVTL